jgi:hypothetical protein
VYLCARAMCFCALLLCVLCGLCGLGRALLACGLRTCVCVSVCAQWCVYLCAGLGSVIAGACAWLHACVGSRGLCVSAGVCARGGRVWCVFV